jgi:hypothetical protein
VLLACATHGAMAQSAATMAWAVRWFGDRMAKLRVLDGGDVKVSLKALDPMDG